MRDSLFLLFSALTGVSDETNALQNSNGYWLCIRNRKVMSHCVLFHLKFFIEVSLESIFHPFANRFPRKLVYNFKSCYIFVRPIIVAEYRIQRGLITVSVNAVFCWVQNLLSLVVILFLFLECYPVSINNILFLFHWIFKTSFQSRVIAVHTWHRGHVGRFPEYRWRWRTRRRENKRTLK